MDLGEILKLIRVTLDLKIKNVSIQIGLSQSFITDIERNQRKMSLSTLKKFASFYNIPVSKIMHFEEISQHGMNRNQVWIEICKYYVDLQEKEHIKHI